jgi:hypothetical protein
MTIRCLAKSPSLGSNTVQTPSVKRQAGKPCGLLDGSIFDGMGWEVQIMERLLPFGKHTKPMENHNF